VSRSELTALKAENIELKAGFKELFAWMNSTMSSPSPPPSPPPPSPPPPPPALLALGHFHSCAYLTGGTLKCWGYNGDEGRLGDGTTTHRYTPTTITA